MENQDNDLLTTAPSKTPVENYDKINRSFEHFVSDEDIIESPPQSIFQTATTCLIPLPVYECTAQEWRLESPVQEWVEFENTKSKSYEALNIPIISQCYVRTANTLDDCLNKESKETHKSNNERRALNSRSSLDGKNSRWVIEDKLKRRKGMYIDHTAWDVSNNVLEHNALVNLDKQIKLQENKVELCPESPPISKVKECYNEMNLYIPEDKELFASEKELDNMFYFHSPQSSKGSVTDDQKRYSKRPLRGPYGQMLEAEMMKPKKQNFDKQQDDIYQPEFARLRERNCPKYSNSMRIQKTNKTIFVPQHPRASSIPLQTKNCFNKEKSNEQKDMDRFVNSCSVSSLETGEFKKMDKVVHKKQAHINKESKLDNFGDVKFNSKEMLLVELLKGSSEQMLVEQRQKLSLVSFQFLIINCRELY